MAMIREAVGLLFPLKPFCANRVETNGPLHIKILPISFLNVFSEKLVFTINFIYVCMFASPFQRQHMETADI